MSYSVIVQARSGSTRLPGKILKKVNDKTLLEYGIERIQKAKKIKEVIIATTVNEKDDVIAQIAKKNGIKYFRGSEADVLARYYYAAKKYAVENVIRITSDCPLIDPDIIDLSIDNYERNECDILTNVPNDGQKLTYPRGMDVEIFSFEWLEEAFYKAKENYEREHVTPYLYTNVKDVYYDKAPKDYSQYRLTLDTKEDLDVITQVIQTLYNPDKTFHLQDIIHFLDLNPDVRNINSNVKQKEI